MADMWVQVKLRKESASEIYEHQSLISLVLWSPNPTGYWEIASVRTAGIWVIRLIASVR